MQTMREGALGTLRFRLQCQGCQRSFTVEHEAQTKVNILGFSCDRCGVYTKVESWPPTWESRSDEPSSNAAMEV